MSDDNPSNRAPSRLRPATERDWPMVRRWLAQPEVIRWWGPKSASEAEVMLAMGTPQALCRIIEARDGSEPWEAVGYAHALDAGMLGDPLPRELATGTWQIDLFIASRRFWGRGLGARALAQLRDEVFATTLTLAVCTIVGIGNEKAVRAYEQVGFRWRAITREPAKGAEWVMVAERPAR